MTTELKKQFFDTFGIEPREFKSCNVDTFCPYDNNQLCDDTCPYYRTYKVDYPAITEHILLKLICINPLCVEFIHPKDISELKNIIIKYFIDNLKSYAELSEAEIFKQQVQALFKE